MLIGEMHVKILRHMSSPQNLVEFTRFMEDFMRYHKSKRIKVRKDEKKCYKVEGSPGCKLKVFEVVHSCKEKIPVNRDCYI
jgi:hypothetical protein